ncbi:MAG: NAD(P)-dependent oxidoreductase [Bryobacter sp.]|nr:NAD(P)-dependent oxidoreductase [Bryobacter sp.]
MNPTFRVGISHDFSTDARGRYEAAVESIFAAAPHMEVELMPLSEDNLPPPEVLNRYDAILALATRVDARNLAGVERLALVSRWGVGYDRIDTQALTEAGVALAITPNAVRRPVAEAALALVFASSLNLVRQHQTVAEGAWRGALPRLGRNVAGRTLASLGFGNIAKEMFRLARSLGFGSFLAHDPYGNAADAAELGVELVDLEDLFRSADYLCVHCLLNEETSGMVNRDRLRLMNPDAHLINTARGPIVREDHLVEALEQGWIAGAALDVFEEEPLPSDAPIRRAPNVILAPHGMAWTEELARDNSLESARNIVQLSLGKVPASIVNREVTSRQKFQEKLERYKQAHAE